MKFAICNETFVDASLEEGFRLASEIGYRGIELAPYTLNNIPGQPQRDVTQLSAKSRSNLRALADQFRLEIVGLHWLLAKTEGLYLTSPDKSTRQRTADYLCELGRLCSDLGGGVMVLGSPQQRNLLPGVTADIAEEFAIEVISSAMETLESLNVTLAIEPLGPAECDFLTTAASAVKFIESIGSANCKLHLDVKAMASESLPMTEIIQAAKPHLVHFHANDPNLLGPGMGEVCFKPIAGALQQINYADWVSVEVFRYEPSPEIIARTSYENLVSVFGQSNSS